MPGPGLPAHAGLPLKQSPHAVTRSHVADAVTGHERIPEDSLSLPGRLESGPALTPTPAPLRRDPYLSPRPAGHLRANTRGTCL